MQVSSIKSPGERNKLILAGGLGIVAILFLWWTFFGFGSSPAKVAPRAAGQPPTAITRSTSPKPGPQTVVDFEKINPEDLRVIPSNFNPISAPEAGRNIFVYYEPPPPVQKPSIIPTPTPTPVPPVLLASLSPANVYAKTGDFTLELSGDKFTSQMRVVIGNSELPTRYLNAQQLSANVPAALIASAGDLTVMVRSTDGKLYSNSLSISVTAPPTPNYSYIGIIGTRKYIDTAILLDKSSKETLNVQRGDLLGGRFRVTSISDKELVVVDNTLKVKHTLSMTTQGDRGNSLQRPTPRVESEDDEP
jgi:hypothetical protein